MYCTHYIPSVLICICTINKDYYYCGHYIEPTWEEDWTDHSAVVGPQKAGMVIVFC